MQEDSTELNSFPLFEGEIRCLTCHEAHGGKPKLLRGGPYSDRRGICFQCHTDQEYANLNPHKMIDGQGAVKKINGEPACLFCHTTLPDATATAENITFKADVAFLCWRCHPPMQGDFFKSHFLVKPSRKAMRQMRKIEREMNVSFPLLNRDRITCSTCHNPHQKGVIVKGPAKAGEDEHDRLRMPPQMICYGCHYNK
jgi:predicted CXXCH cytochrome family protein